MDKRPEALADRTIVRGIAAIQLAGRSAAAGHLRRVAAKYPDRVDDLKAAFAAGLSDKNGLVRQAAIEGLAVC